MKIEDKREGNILFKDLDKGDCFMFDNGEICIKIDWAFNSSNTFSLVTHECFTTSSDKFVTRLNAKVVIE